MLLTHGTALQSTILKVGHHGSRHSTDPKFVEAVQPSVAVIQVGEENSYGHPNSEVLEILNGRTIFRNDLHGRIHITSDGDQMWIEPERD